MKTIIFTFLLLFALPINYQIKVAKKFPQAICIKIPTLGSYPDAFFIAATSDANPRWLSREQSSCDVAWREAYVRNVQ